MTTNEQLLDEVDNLVQGKALGTRLRGCEKCRDLSLADYDGFHSQLEPVQNLFTKNLFRAAVTCLILFKTSHCNSFF